MSWSIGYDSHWRRDIGYGVPAFCDHPGCNEKIDRGLTHVCGGEPYGGDNGCGLFFCGAHLSFPNSLCPRCDSGKPPFPARRDHPQWLRHKLTHPSWRKWRARHRWETRALQRQLNRSVHVSRKRRLKITRRFWRQLFRELTSSIANRQS